jgi:hypothetical protein
LHSIGSNITLQEVTNFCSLERKFCIRRKANKGQTVTKMTDKIRSTGVTSRDKKEQLRALLGL